MSEKLLNADVYGAVNSLNQLVALRDWPIDTSLDIARLLRKLDNPYKAIEEVRLGLVRKYQTVKDDDNGRLLPLQEGHENWDKFVKDFTELMNKDAETIVFDKVEIPKKIDGETVTVKANLMILLEKFVTIKKENSDDS